MTVVYHVYGDESISDNAVVYAVIIVPVDLMQEAEQVISKVKNRYGGSESDELHCSKLFNVEARRHSPWAHLEDEQVYALVVEHALALSRIGAQFRIGFVDIDSTPDVLPKEDDFDEVPLGPKHLAGLAFWGAVGPLDADPGLDKIKLWVDPDRTKIPSYFGKRMRADSMYGGFSDISGLPEPRQIRPETIEGKKPTLLQVADILAYVSSRALSQNVRRDKYKFIFLLELLNPGWSIGGVGKEPSRDWLR